MHLGSEIGKEFHFLFTEKKHAGERSQSQLFRVFTKKETRLYLRRSDVTRFKDESKGPRTAWTAQQRKKNQVIRLSLRALDPEFGEPGELLSARLRRIDATA